MKKNYAVFLVLLVIFLLLSTHAQAAALPDTGQTKCYDNSSEIICPAPCQQFHGQDAHYTRDRSYTKLDQNSNPLPASETTWYQVKDNVTGLIWEVKTDDGSLHDKDKCYIWDDAQSIFIATLNADSYCGHINWRLPTVWELSRLTDSNRINPAIDIVYFPRTNIELSVYWSSTSLAEGETWAWRVFFYHGSVDSQAKTDACNVRAVRYEQ